MLSRPQDFAAIQGAGTTRSHALLSARFLRTDLETTRFGLSTGRRLASTRRPPAVFMRARNPCSFARWRFLG